MMPSSTGTPTRHALQPLLHLLPGREPRHELDHGGTPRDPARSHAATQRLLGALLEQSELEVVRFQSQPSKGGQGVPDAEIIGSFHLLIETKTSPGMVSAPQLRRHLARFDGSKATVQSLLVLTPDSSIPDAVGS